VSKNNFDFSDSENSQEREENDYSPKMRASVTHNGSLNEFTVGDNTSVMSLSKNKDITLKMKQIEEGLKERLSSNWVSVRKAFLDLDEDFDGYITAENFAKIIGGSSGSSKFDFNLLKMMMKMKNDKKDAKINYT